MTGNLILQINTAGAWKNVAIVPAERRRSVASAVMRLAAVLPGASWCLYDAVAHRREWIKVEDARALGMQAVNLALQIADDAAQSDVECYALPVPMENADFRTAYDLDTPQVSGQYTAEEYAAAKATAQRAVAYIEARGPEAFPFRLVRDLYKPNLVWFEKRPAAREA